MMTGKNIVLNVPHSSINGIFDDNIGKWPDNPYFINEHVRKHTDWWTDMLFTVRGEENVTKVVFPYSRFVCDAERMENDGLEEQGQGIICTRFGGFERGALDDEAKAFLLDAWQAHHEELKSHLIENSVLINCHSFSSDFGNTDICIGFNDDWSFDKRLVDDVAAIFKSYGYSVAFNAPYSNSTAPKTDFEYKSIVIGVNKRIYMNEELLILEKNQIKWIRWKGCLRKIYQRVKEGR